MDTSPTTRRGAALLAVAVVLTALLLALVNDGNDEIAVATRVRADTPASSAPATTKAKATTTTRATGATTTVAPATTTVPAAARPNLALGASGPDVTTLQNRLIVLKYDPGAADGVFGAKTATAVTAFQRAAGLTADGHVGALTWAALDAAR